MPPPLQLVAYLPVVECVSWQSTQEHLLRTLSIPVPGQLSKEKVKTRAGDEEALWHAVRAARANGDDESLGLLWGRFGDPDALASRAKAYSCNGGMQPTEPREASGLLSSPALYDCIDVSLSLSAHEELPMISVPAWKSVKP